MTGNDSSGAPRDTRSSALWGTGNRGGESRSNALWSKGGRGLALSLVALFVLSVPLAIAGEGKRHARGEASGGSFIDPMLVAFAQHSPNAHVNVIIRSADGSLFKARRAFRYAARIDGSEDRERVRNHLGLVESLAVTIKAKKVKQLARLRGLVVTHDAPVRFAATPTSAQLWPTASAVRPFYSEALTNVPTIAIVDSGIEKNRADFDFGARVVDEVVVTKLEPNSNGDGRGHGTFVAGIAAGSAPSYAGAAPGAKIVSIDVMDDSGMARTSDVIAAAAWIYNNRGSRNIRVANFSLHSTTPSSFTWDPLDKAVEKLWLGGVVVVAAAGNYGSPTGGPSGVKFAPGNDPFVVTVGAVDLDGSVRPWRHDVPTWSAYGYTYDGFRKPEIAAAGRYMIGPVPATATLPRDRPDNVVGPGYMRLSGTSFAAPVVAGAAALVLAKHPTWTPDQVKGALMLRARHVGEAPPGSAGVGEVNAYRAASVVNPPNPNGGLNRFLVADPIGGETAVFDAASWQSVARANASWDSVSWSDVSWTDASWQSVSWQDVSWDSVSWTDVSWTDSLAVGDVSWEDAASTEVAPPSGDYILTPEEEALALLDPELAPPAPTPEPAPTASVTDTSGTVPLP